MASLFQMAPPCHYRRSEILQCSNGGYILDTEQYISTTYLWKEKSSFQLVQNGLKINPISKILFCQTIAHCLAIAFFERHCIKDKIITVKYYHNKNSNSVILVLNFLPLCQEFLQRELWALLEATNSQDRVVNFRQSFREGRTEERRQAKWSLPKANS